MVYRMSDFRMEMTTIKVNIFPLNDFLKGILNPYLFYLSICLRYNFHMPSFIVGV
jgi:hypothetical protein